jgi:hypothetical protein
MADCCENKSCAIEALRERQSGTLKIVLVINAVMFLVVLAAGLLADSSAVIAFLALVFLRSAMRVFRGAFSAIRLEPQLK